MRAGEVYTFPSGMSFFVKPAFFKTCCSHGSPSCNRVWVWLEFAAGWLDGTVVPVSVLLRV